MSAGQPWAPLGELLVERGLLSQRQLELALQEHQRTGRRLGEVLVGFGFVSHESLTNTLLQQVGLAVEQTPLLRVPEPQVVPAPAPAPAPQPEAPAPVIVRLDAEPPRGNPLERKAAELEAQLEDFERRAAEIQTAIVEMRRLIADLRAGARLAV